MALGRLDVDEMLSELSVHQLREWEQYFLQEPFGSIRDDQRTAVLIQTILNILSTRPISFQEALDLLPKFSVQQPSDIDRESAVAADKARVKAWIQSGYVKVVGNPERASEWMN